MEGIARRPRTSADSPWQRYEGPTWAVASIVYGWWGLLIWFHACIPWWLTIPLGAVVIAWHNSLQHETIHALARVPRALRFALGFPPLALVVPYPIYCRSHRRHHRDAWLTDPLEDPESYYHPEQAWLAYPQVIRFAYLFNQALVGRLTLGPVLYLIGFLKRETTRVVEGDRSNLAAWGWHAASAGLLLFWVSAVAGMPIWQYLLLVVYPGLCLGMLRSFCEHRYAERVGQRTAIVESGFPFNVLFLNNNLHLIHHLSPALPWYRIPAVWRESRAELLEHNGGFYFTGYGEIAAKYFTQPAFIPAQPRHGKPLPADRMRIRPAGAT
jgi:fatty acid desaturase